MRVSKHKTVKSNKRSQRPPDDNPEWKKLDSLLGTLIPQAEAQAERSWHVQRIILSVKGEAGISGIADEMVETFRQNYSESALSRLLSSYAEQFSAIEGEATDLRDKVCSLHGRLRAACPTEEIWRILNVDISPEAETLPILRAFKERGREYFEALQQYEREQEKQESKLAVKVQHFQQRCSGPLREILERIDAGGSALPDSELPGIVCGAPVSAFDVLPSDPVLEAISQYPEAARQFIKAVVAFKNGLIDEYSDLLCLDEREKRKIPDLPSLERLAEIRSLRDELSAGKWKQLIGRLPLEARCLTPIEGLRKYFAAEEKLRSFEDREIVLPRQYSLRIDPRELIRRGVDHPRVAGLDKLLPAFANELPIEVHRRLTAWREKAKGLLARDGEIRSKSIDPELVADIIVFGFLNFASYDPCYPLHVIHERVHRVGSFEGSFELFADMFERKLFELRHCPLFRRSMERGVHRSTLVQFDSCGYITSALISGLGKIEEGIYECALKGNDVVRRNGIGCRLRYLLEDAISITQLSRNFFGEIVNTAEEARYDVARAVQIAANPANFGCILEASDSTPRILIADTVGGYLEHLGHLQEESIEADRESLSSLGVQSLPIASLAEEILAECEGLAALFDGTELKDYFEFLVSHGMSNLSEWAKMLDLFEPFYEKNAEELDMIHERSAGLLSELQVWRGQNES